MARRWALLLFLAALPPALYILAKHSLYRHLDCRAASELAQLAAGDSPWQWFLARPDSLIGGRPVEGTFDRSDRGVAATSPELLIALKLRGEAIDSRRYGLLELVIEADSTSPQSLVGVALQFGPDLRATLPRLELGRFGPGQHRIDLPSRDCAAAECWQAAAHLRQLQLLVRPLAGAARVHSVRLLPLVPVPLQADSPRPMGQVLDDALWPLERLSPGLRTPEASLLLVDLRRQQEPALVVFSPRLGGATVGVCSQLSELPRNGQWVLLAMTLLLLLWARWRWTHPGVELGLALGLPWLLILLGALVDDTPVPLLAALAVSLLYALSLPARPLPAPTRRAAHAWWLALALPGVLTLAAVLGAESSATPVTTERLLRYALWVFIQQWILYRVLLQRWYAWTGSGAWSIALTGAAFALLHWPNHGLMQLCLVGGLIWAWSYLHQRNLLALVLSHYLAALLAFHTLPPWLLRSAEVGQRAYMAVPINSSPAAVAPTPLPVPGPGLR